MGNRLWLRVLIVCMAAGTTTVLRIQKALERAGVRFSEDETGGFGVWLQAKTKKPKP